MNSDEEGSFVESDCCVNIDEGEFGLDYGNSRKVYIVANGGH